jgi:predicted ester cyclase
MRAGTCQTAGMELDLDRLMAVWDAPVGPGTADDFRALYAEPFLLNGVSVPIDGLVKLAGGLHAAVVDQNREILDVVVETPGKVAVAFVVRGRHVGVLPTRAGSVAATGRPVEMTVIDIFTVVDGLITEVRAVSDELGMLAALDVLAVKNQG